MIYLSKILVKKEKQLNDWKEGVIPLLVPIIVICGIILVDNLSTGLMLFFISMILLFIGRFPWKKWLSIIGAGVLLLTMAITVHEAFPSLDLLPRYDTWKARVTRQFSDESAGIENAQANNAELAIYNGSITGQGVGDGRLKSYIPEAYADFYFASFIEEFGLISGVLLILLYLILLLRIIKIALKSDVLFESYLCLAIGIHLLFQSSINRLACNRVF